MVRPAYRHFYDASITATVEAMRTAEGRLHFIQVNNPNTVQVFLQIFDVASGSVTLNSTVPNLSLLIPAGDGTEDGGFTESWPDGIQFDTAISYAITTTATGSTAASSTCAMNAAHGGSG